MRALNAEIEVRQQRIDLTQQELKEIEYLQIKAAGIIEARANRIFISLDGARERAITEARRLLKK